jgi:hypothetical protein
MLTFTAVRVTQASRAAQWSRPFLDPDGTVLRPAPILKAVREPLPDFDPESVPHWSGHQLDLDHVLSTLMQRRDLRQQQRDRLQQKLLAA